MIDKCLAAKKRRLMQWVLPITYDVDFLVPSPLLRAYDAVYTICVLLPATKPAAERCHEGIISNGVSAWKSILWAMLGLKRRANSPRRLLGMAIISI